MPFGALTSSLSRLPSCKIDAPLVSRRRLDSHPSFLSLSLLLRRPMERYRGETYGDHMESQHHYRPSRGGPHSSTRSSSDAHAPMSQHQHRSPSNYRGGSGRGDRRAFDSPPRFPPGTGGAGAGGFRPVGGDGGGGGGYNSGYQMPPMSGQKRAYPFSGRGGGSPGNLIIDTVTWNIGICSSILVKIDVYMSGNVLIEVNCMTFSISNPLI